MCIRDRYVSTVWTSYTVGSWVIFMPQMFSDHSKVVRKHLKQIACILGLLRQSMTGCKPQAKKRVFVALVRPHVHVECCAAVIIWNSWLKKLKIQNELPDGSFPTGQSKLFVVTTLWGDVHTTGVALSDHEENHPDLLSSFQDYSQAGLWFLLASICN